MSRKAVLLECSEEDKRVLEKLSSGGKVEKRLHDRAKIILSCLKGKTNVEIAAEQKISRFTVAKWRTRFAKKGMAGLGDKPRPGTPKRYNDNLRNQIFKQ